MQRTFTVQELATLTGAELRGDGTRIIDGVADLARALPSEAAFFANPRYEKALQQTRAGVVCVADATGCPAHFTLLVHSDPSRTFQRIAEILAANRPPLTGFSGIHATAVVHPTALVQDAVTIGPYAVIDAGVCIGQGTHIGAHVYVGPQTRIGENCVLHPHATVREGCTLGNRVILQPGAVIGACGFGYTTSAEGQHTKLEQIGAVHLADDVEIGANTTIDRGRFPSQSTRIGRGTKLDNLVQIAHGVSVGDHSVMAGQSGVAGSTKIGSYSAIGGQVAIAGHLTLAACVKIAGKSGVSKSLPSGTYGGIPAQPLGEYNRGAVWARRVPLLAKQLEEQQRILAALLAIPEASQ